MMKPTIRLTLYLARENARAVILRTGPSKLNRLILWDRDTDTFTDGQWLKARIYPERCDLSADGRHFLYFALDGRWDSESLGSYTAISQPPWFTALALFAQGDTWAGGGRFLDRRRFHLHTADEASDLIGRATEVERVFRVTPEGRNTLGFADARGRRVNLDAASLALAEGRDQAAPLATEYRTEGAKLYRLDAAGDRHLIRDFTDMAFEPMRAPYDWREPDTAEPEPWHPLDGDTV